MRLCWGVREPGGSFLAATILACVHVLSAAVVGGEECAGVHAYLQRDFALVSSQIGGRGAGAPSLCSADSASPPLSCCPASLVDEVVRSSPGVLLAAFNNSDQFGRFKSRISEYEVLVGAHESGNAELWNATIDGLRVLRSWGVRYWDPEFLHKSQVLREDCVRRVVAGRVCGGCRNGPVVKPCKTLCHNVVVGCIKPLADYIESPWKHAVNSVRTAIRIVITTGGDAKQNMQPLQELVSDLNDWREPVTWWVSDYKRTISCEGLPTTDCWNGSGVGKYEYGTATLKSQFNPEVGVGGNMQPHVILELERFRNELVRVKKSLEKFWPSAPSQNLKTYPPAALALSSSESGSYVQDLVTDHGSGDDEDDLEYSNSGYGPHMPTDDEDLVEYGSGEGSGEGPPSDLDEHLTKYPKKVTDGTGEPVSPTTQGSGGPRFGVSGQLVATLLLLLYYAI